MGEDGQIERREVASIWDITFGEPTEGSSFLGRVVSREVTGPNQVTTRTQQANGSVVDFVVNGSEPTPEIEQHFWEQKEIDADPSPVEVDAFAWLEGIIPEDPTN